MKKKFRFIAMLAIMALILSTLSGCMSLDDLRKDHAVYNDKQSIVYNDVEYKQIANQNGYLKPHVSDTLSNIYVTEADVPVLLSQTIGSHFWVSDDGRFLIADDYTYSTIYCRTDCYDEIFARVTAKFVPTGYCYAYDKYNKEDYNHTEGLYHLTDKQTAVIRKVLTTVTAEEYSFLPQLDFNNVVELEACSDDMLFRNYVMDIYQLSVGYCLVLQEDKDSKVTIYPVPANLGSEFADILKPMLEQEQILNEKYEDDEGYSV